ncbi:MAG: LysE family translocator [Flavobacteriaceae bacterium]|nr:LysE family translocator [Flavobacteriaceae bacterium]
MELKDILNAIPLGIALSFMIGPVFFVLLETSVLKGIKEAVFFDIGVIVSDIFFISIAYFGSHQILEKIKDDPSLFVFGGIIMLVYGLISLLKKKENIIIEDVNLKVVKKYLFLRLFFKGFFLNFINIGVLAFWIGMVVVVGPNVGMNPTRIFNFFFVIIVSYFTVDLIKIYLAKQLQSKMTPTVVIKIKRIMGVLLIVFGLFLMLKGMFPKKVVTIVDTVIEKVK